MKYKVISATMSSLKDKNATAKQVSLVLCPEEPFATRLRTWSLIIDGSQIPMWETIISKGEFPVFNGTNVLVEDLPNYRSNYGNGGFGPILNSMRVFIRLDGDGNPCEDPRTVALKAIEKYSLEI